MKIWQNVYEGLNFSHVKFYHDLSAGLKNLRRKPQNFGDNRTFASMLSYYKIVNWKNKIHINKDMFQVSYQNIENFSRNSEFQVGGFQVRVRVLILVCAIDLTGSGEWMAGKKFRRIKITILMFLESFTCLFSLDNMLYTPVVINIWRFYHWKFVLVRISS